MIALAGQLATGEEERHNQERKEVDTKAAEQEVTKLRAEAAKMMTMKRLNAAVKKQNERMHGLAEAEMEKRRGEALKGIGCIQEEVDDVNEEIQIIEEEKEALKAAKDAAEAERKLPAPAPKGVDAGDNTGEPAEAVAEERIECVRPDAMVGVVPAALRVVGDRHHLQKQGMVIKVRGAMRVETRELGRSLRQSSSTANLQTGGSAEWLTMWRGLWPMGRVIGMRWLLGARPRVAKVPPSFVVFGGRLPWTKSPRSDSGNGILSGPSSLTGVISVQWQGGEFKGVCSCSCSVCYITGRGFSFLFDCCLHWGLNGGSTGGGGPH